MAEWSLVISILALGVALMALPTVFQMVFGKVKIETDYKVMPVGDQLHLECFFRNCPIRNKFLKAMGVRRETANSVQANFSITDKTGNFIVKDVIAGIMHGFEGDFEGKVKVKIQTSLPASNNFAGFVVVFYAGNKVMIVGDGEHPQRGLPIGNYNATIEIITSEQKLVETKEFMIYDNGLGWCN